MIIYEPTTDIEFITKCVTDPVVWRASTDDGMIHVNPDMFFVPTDGKLWLRAGDYGLFMGEPRNSVTYEVHTMLLPEARGKALDIAKGALYWKRWLHLEQHRLRVFHLGSWLRLHRFIRHFKDIGFAWVKLTFNTFNYIVTYAGIHRTF